MTDRIATMGVAHRFTSQVVTRSPVGVLAVLELDALRQQLVADAVGLGEVLCCVR